MLERIRAATGSTDTTVRERVQTLDEQKRHIWENRDLDPQEIRSARENMLNIHAVGTSAIARRELPRAMHRLTLTHSGTPAM